MTNLAHATAADKRHAFRKAIIAEIADAIRADALEAVQAKYPAIPSRVMAEAQYVADLADAEEWWRAVGAIREAVA